MKKIIAFSLLFLVSNLGATEFKVKDFQVKFAKVKITLNGAQEFYWSLTKGDDRYSDYIAIATNTVVRNYLSPNSDEVNLSTCALRWYSEAEFKAAKKGYVTSKIRELKDNVDDEEIIDLKARINWLKLYRTINGK
jgi:hypothetical protein